MIYISFSTLLKVWWWTGAVQAGDFGWKQQRKADRGISIATPGLQEDEFARGREYICRIQQERNSETTYHQFYSSLFVLLCLFCFVCFALFVLLCLFCFVCFALFVLLCLFCFVCFALFVLLCLFCFVCFALFV